MIDFGNFYQLIAKGPLAPWLETVPGQLAAWQRESLHGQFKQWFNTIHHLPEVKPYRLDLLHGVHAEAQEPLSAGQQLGIEKLLRNLMPWRKGPFSLYGVNIDTEFSMGVLYHRRSPLDHLYQLKNQLVSEGELVLETLVVEGDENTVLVPGERYAQMRNVYFIPSALALKNWLEKCGFVDVRIVDSCTTTTEEQRRTSWLTTESLADFLDPNDSSKTIEGYPAPVRAVLVARKP